MNALAGPLARTSVATRPWPIAQLIALAAIAAALVLLGMAPFVNRNEIGTNKYIPVFIAWAGWAVHLVTCRAAFPQCFAVLRRHWRLALVGMAMSAGFVVAMREHTVTFRPHALALLTFLPICHLAACADTARFVRAALVLLGLASIYILSLAIINFPRHIVHENLYLFTPAACFLALVARAPAVRWAVVAWIALFAVVGLKNTTFIIAGLSIYGLHVFGQRAVRDGSRSPVQWRSLLLLALAGLVGWVLLDLIKEQVEAFSSGNAEFRTHLYEQKWRMFLDSPLWGDLWSTTPNLRFRLFTVGNGGINFLPSHSDVLDWLAHGGVLGAAAVLTAIVGIIRRALPDCREDRGGRLLYAERATLIVICCAALVSASFNPVLGNPANGFMFWTMFALLAALELRGIASDGTGGEAAPVEREAA